MFRLQLLLFALMLGLVQLLFGGVGIGIRRRDGIICCMCCRSKTGAATRIADNAIIAFS